MKQIIAGGLGFVGRSVKELFPLAEVYDKGFDVPEDEYDFCHICVPTPQNPSGSCNTVAVEDVLSKIKAKVYIIRSTVYPGFCQQYKNVVFQPEYCASSSPYPAPLADLRRHSFIILGGNKVDVKKVRRLYETVYPPTTRIIEMTSMEAEITKLMENCFIATYVTFCNEFYNICQKLKADYDVVREGFLADPRMTPWWSYITSEKGWGGHCLPKDTANLIHSTGSPFMRAVVKNNRRHKQ